MKQAAFFPALELNFFKKAAEFSASIFNLCSKPFLTIFHDCKPFLTTGQIHATDSPRADEQRLFLRRRKRRTPLCQNVM